MADTPDHDPQVRGDPFKTLFLSRLNYSVKESDLEREFGRFGPIERVSYCSPTLKMLVANHLQRLELCAIRKLVNIEGMRSLYTNERRT